MYVGIELSQFDVLQVIDLRPSGKHKSPARSRVNVVVSSHVAEAPIPAPSGPHKAHPTGLVTKLGGTVVKEGVTTVHETSVIGTFISGKYAQVRTTLSANETLVRRIKDRSVQMV